MKRTFSLPKAPEGCFLPVFRPEDPWLAPLAGYSDLSFRLLCRELGARVCETEMVSAKGLLYRSPGTDQLLKSVPGDQPLVVQLFGSEPEIIAQAAIILRKAGYNTFDFNLGCPARKVMRQKSGSALLEDPELALEIAEALICALQAQGEGLPETPGRTGFKFRLDAADSQNFVSDFGRRLEDLGASWLCLHPRTAAQGYGGVARWERIRQLVEAVEIPVIASGDLFTASAAVKCLQETGAACAMYARASLKNPFIFTQHRAAMEGREAPELDRAALMALIERHIAITREYCGDRRAFGKIRSIIPRYVRHLQGVGVLRKELAACADWDALSRSLAHFMEAS